MTKVRAQPKRDKNVSPKGGQCRVRGCTRPRQAHGICHAHYVRVANGGELGGPIRKQRPRLTPKEREEICRKFQAGVPIGRLAVEYEIAKGPVQRLLRAAGLR